MADTKITALAAITTVDPAADVLPIVDISDTSMAASGTTKKITSNQILGSGGTATLASAAITGAATVGTTLGVTGVSTLASATITGDLTVDTSTLKVDSTNNRVGIGTATPGVRVDILSDNNTSLAAVLRVNSNNAAVNTSFAYDGIIASGGMTLQTGASPFIVNTNGATERYRIATDGTATWSVAGTTAMTLNSTGLGIGASPSNYRLYVSAAFASGLNGAYIESGEFNKKSLVVNHTNASVAVNLFEVQKVGTAQFLVDSSGNVGVGVTTFGTSAAKVLAIGTGTEPTTGPAGTVQLFTSTRSASNTIPAIFTEGSGVTNAAITNTTVTNKIAIKVNGTIYYLLATTSAA